MEVDVILQKNKFCGVPMRSMDMLKSFGNKSTPKIYILHLLTIFVIQGQSATPVTRREVMSDGLDISGLFFTLFYCIFSIPCNPWGKGMMDRQKSGINEYCRRA